MPLRRSPRRPRPRLLRTAAGLLAGLYLAALFGVLGTAWLGGARAGPLAFGREMLLFLVAPAPVLAGLGMLARSRVALLLVALPFALFVYLHGPHLVSRAPAQAEGDRVRVMTFNVGAARGLGDPGAVAQTIRSLDPDIVCLVEARANTLQSIGGPLQGTYPYQVGSRSVFVVSRFPLAEARPLALGVRAHDALVSDVVIGDRIAALAVVHLRRIDAYQGLAAGPWTLARTAARFDPTPRDQVAAELMEALRSIGGSIVLAGDFNTTPWSHTHELLTADLRDSFREAGLGFGHTYPATLRIFGSDLLLPLIRIDYVFHSPDIIALDARVGPEGGSDHLPVIADLAFR